MPTTPNNPGLADLDGLYHLDPDHSSIGFVIRHAGISKVRGRFDSFHGWGRIDQANPEHSALLVTVIARGLDTRDSTRDAHVRSADFLDVERYPAITFVGTGFRIEGEEVEISGDLTIRDVTRPIIVRFSFEGAATDPFGNERVGFTGATTLKRSDFGLTWNAVLETGGVLVSDAVRLEFEVSAVKQADPEQ